MKSKWYIIFILGLSISLNSCVKKLPLLEDPNPNDDESVLTGIIVDDNFNWETSNIVTASIHTLSNTGAAIPNIKVSLFTDYKLFGGKEIISGYTKSNGLFESNYRFASATDSLVVATDYLGFISEVKVPIIDGKLDFILGGIPPADIPDSPTSPSNKSTRASNTKINLKYLGEWKNDGKPKYLENNDDNISYSFLTEINNALQEGQSVPSNHSEYLENSNKQYIHLTESAEVYVTFVAEGADYKSALAFYTFNENNPPQSINDISEATVIFPNASFKNGGGGLYSGNKVRLGQFAAETSIGWLLISDAYQDKMVTDGENYFFSHKNLNPESNSSYQQHIVLLKNTDHDKFIIAFEDMKRPDGDQDFNDVIFYATANPTSAVDNSSFPTMGGENNDIDGDGVANNFDAYPNDDTKAFNNYYPSEGNYATLAFEDLWPSKGDYDFNDLVLDYNFNTITNANNDVVELTGRFIVRAIGAGFLNGFGFEIENVAYNKVNYALGSALTDGYINLGSNGTEAGQSNATIIVFDNAKNHGNWNTDPTVPFITPTEVINIEVKLSAPIPLDQFGVAPFNPFLIINKERGRELHLANNNPTDLANLSYFGKYNDDSNPSTGKYYKTTGNLPWVINFPVQFEYPVEKASIASAHLKFINWVQSSGVDYKDWYLNRANYRNSLFIY